MRTTSRARLDADVAFGGVHLPPMNFPSSPIELISIVKYLPLTRICCTSTAHTVVIQLACRSHDGVHGRQEVVIEIENVLTKGVFDLRGRLARPRTSRAASSATGMKADTRPANGPHDRASPPASRGGIARPVQPSQLAPNRVRRRRLPGATSGFGISLHQIRERAGQDADFVGVLAKFVSVAFELPPAANSGACLPAVPVSNRQADGRRTTRRCQWPCRRSVSSLSGQVRSKDDGEDDARCKARHGANGHPKPNPTLRRHPEISSSSQVHD